MEDKVYVLISYVPLLRGKAGSYLDLSAQSGGNLDKIKEIIGPAFDSAPDDVKGCAWQTSDGSPQPLLVIDHMDEIINHLIEWGDGVPQRWFNLHLYEHNNRYAVALIPNLERSIERFISAMKIFNNIEVDRRSKFNLIFRPLMFTSAPHPKTYGTVKDKLPERIMLRAIDATNLTHQPHAFQVEQEKVRDIASFKVRHDSFNGYLDKILEGG